MYHSLKFGLKDYSLEDNFCEWILFVLPHSTPSLVICGLFMLSCFIKEERVLNVLKVDLCGPFGYDCNIKQNKNASKYNRCYQLTSLLIALATMHGSPLGVQ